MDKCHVCGSAEVSRKSTFGSPLCERCLPVQQHVVSMQTGPGGAVLAICQCGKEFEATGDGRHEYREAWVKAHWAGAIAAAEAGHG